MMFFKNMKAKFFSLNALLLITIALSVSAFAQQEAGQINGTVKDANDAAIPGAAVTARNTATNATRTTTSDEAGEYAFLSLQPGNYEISAGKQGFQDAKQTVQVTTGGRITLNLTAGVSNVAAQVDITSAGGAEINTSDQQLSTVVSGRQIQELPILNRNPYSLVGLSGNVSPADPSGRGAGFAINGQRAASTSILLDGAENSDTFTAGIAQLTPLDSVAEFQVITSNFSAEYGRASGGIVNVSTRPGSNRFTGSLFAYNRNSALAANSFDNNANDTERPFFNRNQFGYIVSGPLPYPNFGEGGPMFKSGKDKLFFSNSTEFTRVRSSAPVFVYVPTASFLATTNINTRNFFTTYGSRIIGTPVGAPQSVNIGTTAAPIIIPNAFQRVSYLAPVDAGGGTPQNTYSTVTRIDWNASDRTQFYGRLATNNFDFPTGTVASSPYAGYDVGTTSLNNNLLLNLTHNFTENLISNSKFAYRRADNDNTITNDPNTPTLYFFNNRAATLNGDPIILPGYLPFNPGVGLPTSGIEQLYQFNEDLALVAGKHTIKFGGQFIRLANDLAFPAYQNAALSLGTTNANAIANLINGQLNRIQVAVNPQGRFPGQSVNLPVAPPNFERNNRYNEYAVYAQDGWRISPRLTLNLGLRYEWYGPQKSTTGEDANFYFGSGANIFQQIRSGSAQVAGNSSVGGLWKKDNNNFAPRVGFAWDVTGDGNTSVRGGYGIAYERNFGNVTFNVIQNPPFYAVLSATAADFGGSLPIPISNFGPLAGSSGSRILPVSSLRHVREDIVNAYAHFWSLAGERRVFKDAVVRVEYSGSAGRDLYSIENINRTGSGLRFLGSNNASVCPAGFAPNTRLNCQYSNINTRGNNGYSDYNGVNFSFTANNFADYGLAITANYTYSVTKDNLSSTFSESGNNFNLGLTDPFDPSYDYGYADFDIRHRFVTSFSWNLPTDKYLGNGFAKTLLGGFALTGIVTTNSGTPFTVFDCTNATETTCIRLVPSSAISNRPNRRPTDLGGNSFTYIDLTGQTPSTFTDVSGGTETGPYPSNATPRNYFRGLGGFNVDLGIIKNFRFTERYNFQVRAEFINAFNMTDFQVVGASADLTGGAVLANKVGSGAGGTARTIQLSAKFNF